MLERVSLFSSKRELLLALYFLLFILCYTLLIEYQNYKNFIRFDSVATKAIILKQYPKTRITKNNKTKNYQVLKLQSNDGYTFYTTAKPSFPPSLGKQVELLLFPKEIDFYSFMSIFFASSSIKHREEKSTIKQLLNDAISSAHESEDAISVYQALYSATTLNNKLQTTFSNLGVSHLLAISGFHLGILSALLYLLFSRPYRYLHERYFPYRHQKRDIFFLVAFVLFLYTLFLDAPPSVVRAYGMLIVGFVLYDRGIIILSMQTLFVTLFLLLAFFPRLFFALGFWLSSAGVFYIFLFLIYFKEKSKLWQFIVLPFWVYIMMLPYSLSIFANFSFLHPLSILWTSIFSLFYPLSIVLHLIGFGDLLDGVLEQFIALGEEASVVKLELFYLALFIVISLAAIFKKNIMHFLVLLALSFCIYAIYHLT